MRQKRTFLAKNSWKTLVKECIHTNKLYILPKYICWFNIWQLGIVFRLDDLRKTVKKLSKSYFCPKLTLLYCWNQIFKTTITFNLVFMHWNSYAVINDKGKGHISVIYTLCLHETFFNDNFKAIFSQKRVFLPYL